MYSIAASPLQLLRRRKSRAPPPSSRQPLLFVRAVDAVGAVATSLRLLPLIGILARRRRGRRARRVLVDDAVSTLPARGEAVAVKRRRRLRHWQTMTIGSRASRARFGATPAYVFIVVVVVVAAAAITIAERSCRGRLGRQVPEEIGFGRLGKVLFYDPLVRGLSLLISLQRGAHRGAGVLPSVGGHPARHDASLFVCRDLTRLRRWRWGTESPPALLGQPIGLCLFLPRRRCFGRSTTLPAVLLLTLLLLLRHRLSVRCCFFCSFR